MVNSIPNEYLIIDKRTAKQFSKITFSKYMLKDVTAALSKSLMSCKLEEAMNWSVELLISGYIEKFWDKILTIGIKNVNINNPNLGYFLYTRYSKYIDLSKKYDSLAIRNSQCSRNLVAEVCFTVCNSLKTKSISFAKIKENDFNMSYLESKVLANDPDIVKDKLKYGDPCEAKMILNEFNYCLINKKYELCVYWLSWIFDWEKRNTKKDKMYICGVREIQNVDKKYYTNLSWLVWEIILKEGVKTNNEFLNKQIQSLYKLYKFNFKSSNKGKKAPIFLYAIKYFTDNYHYGKDINNYNILVQVTLNINNLFFEKANCAINNNSVREEHAFNKSKQEIVTELNIKKQKEKTSTEKKKLVELKKAADLKMKLKIRAVEEIDKIILSKK